MPVPLAQWAVTGRMTTGAPSTGRPSAGLFARGLGMNETRREAAFVNVIKESLSGGQW